MKHWLSLLISFCALIAALAWVTATSDLQPLETALAGLSWQTSATVFALFMLASSLASARLWFIARDIRSPISPHDAVAALTLGTLAGALFFQIMGQTIARSTLLARRGTPVAATLVMTGYERAVALLVSLLFGTCGACYLFGKVSLDLQQGGGELLKLVVVGCLAVSAGAYFAWGRFITDWLRPALRAAHVGKATRSLSISIAIQLCTLAAYLVAALAVAPNLRFVDVAAASAVVMLATALPISFAGWGIREFSAVLALGAIGMPAESALAVALQVGIMSLGALMLLSAASLVGNKLREKEKRQQTASFARPNFETLLAWSIPVAVATLIFFQVYIPTAQGTKLNVNLADPLAVVSGALFLLAAVRTRSLPDWRVSAINQNMLLATAAMTAALVIGWSSFGWTAWAFASKFVGWFVLLAYGLTGALIVSKGGDAGRNALFLTFVVAGAAVGSVEIGLALLQSQGLVILPAARASGVAANPNAFALQMVLVVCTALVVIDSRRLMAIVFLCALGALWLSASRAGLGAVILVFAAALILLPSRRGMIAYAGLAPAVSIVCIEAVHLAYHVLSGTSEIVRLSDLSPLGLMAVSPDWERWKTITDGWALFEMHPFFGAGLGAFAEGWRNQFGVVQVIHSTPVWLLAEFGIVGSLLVALPFARVALVSFVEATEQEPMFVLALLICLVLMTFSAVHEVLYQRSFWFLFGAALTLGYRGRKKDSTSAVAAAQSASQIRGNEIG